MYIMKINFDNLSIDNNNKSFFYNLKEGQKISPQIIEKNNNKITVKLNNSIFNLNFRGNIKEQVGDFINLAVKKNKNGKCELEYFEDKNSRLCELKNSTKYDELRNSLNSINIKVTNKNLDIAQIMKQNKINITSDKFKKANQLEKQIENVVKNIDEKSLSQAKELGYSLNKITLDIMSKIIKYTQDENILTDDELKNKINEEVNEYKDIFKDENKLENIIEKLTKEGVNVTRSVIEQCLSFKKIIDQFNNIDSKAIAYLIRNNKELSIENIYQSIHSTNNLNNLDNKQTLEELSEEQLIKFIKSLGLQINDNILVAAKELLKNDLDISVNNIYKVIKLNSLKQISETDKNKLLKNAVKLLKKSQSLLSFNINDDKLENNMQKQKPLSGEKINKIIKQLPNISETDIKRVLNSNMELNLSNLLNLSTEDNVQDSYIDNKEYSKEQKLITAKRQVEEIRLKLTVEAANKLNSKSININTAQLEDLVNELKTLEKETYSMDLDRAGAKVTDDNVETIKNIMDTASYIKQSNNIAIGKVSKNEIPFELNEIANATKNYESQMTLPDSYYGDTFKKIEEQIKPLLQQLGINDSEANIRAASILIKNDMEVNISQLEHMKMLDQKVLNVINNLNPNTAAHMIKDGFNPLNMHVDEVMQYINKFQDEYGVNTKENIAQFILQLDKQQALLPSERQGMIGIYRMLNTIQNSEGKAVGFLMKNNMELTFENLFDTAKYLDKSRNGIESIDVSINDDFGMLTKIKGIDNNIRQQILDALTKSNLAKTENNLSLVKDLTLENIDITPQNLIKSTTYTDTLKQLEQILSPEAIEWLNNNSPQYDQINIENIIEQLKQLKQQNNNNKVKSSDDIKNLISSIKKLNGNQQSLSKFMTANNVKASIENLTIIKENMDNEFYMRELFTEIDDILSKNDKDEMRMSNNLKNNDMKPLSQLDEELKQYLDKIETESLSFNENDKKIIFKDAFQLDRLANIQKSLDTSDASFYQIPIVYQDKATNLNMYVLNDKEQETDWGDKRLKAIFSLKTENLGVIRCLMTTYNKNVQFDFQTERQEDKEFLSGYGKQLKDVISEIGYSLMDTNYEVVPYKNIYETVNKELPDLKNKNINNIKKYQDSEIEITI